MPASWQVFQTMKTISNADYDSLLKVLGIVSQMKISNGNLKEVNAVRVANTSTTILKTTDGEHFKFLSKKLKKKGAMQMEVIDRQPGLYYRLALSARWALNRIVYLIKR